MPDNPSLATLSVVYGHERAARMLEARTMRRIRAAVATSADPVLDLHIFHRREVWAVETLCTGTPHRLFLDVPLRAIVALDHKNFAPAAHSWRTLLDGVHGVGWEQSAIDWMESEIGTSPFAPDNAAGGLRLQAAGGALRCTNGMHRLVAAVCWLAATKGGDARRRGTEVVLRQVDVRLRAIHAEAAELVVQAVDRGARVDVAGHEETGGWIRVVERRSARFFDFDGARLKLRPAMSLLDRIGQFRDPTDPTALRRTWQPVTSRLAAALRDDGWLRAQISAPRYADTPTGGE
ncbi:hypothetical protein KNO81_41135 [Paraburkholderia sediminicola]|nr:hypothetical protein [Paraburkholderia sediminicola]